jgi:hypothetical protein
MTSSRRVGMVVVASAFAVAVVVAFAFVVAKISTAGDETMRMRSTAAARDDRRSIVVGGRGGVWRWDCGRRRGDSFLYQTH